TLQEALQPPIPSDVLGLDVGSYYRAALQESRIGGDFYDLFAIGDHTHAVIIGDVSGKGLAAAAQVATVRNMLRCVLYGKQNLAKAITSLNEMLTTRDLLAGFVTLFVGVYHTETGMLNYISCGHEPALLRRAETGATEALDSIAPPLGIAETSIYEELTARLRPGDALILYTDGISEAGVTRQDLLNTQGIIKIINSAPEGADADAIAKRIVAGAEEHSQGRQRDDICLLTLVARTPSA
ncbi:MAG: rsbP 3, partial [Capsulimonas sp.]|nr:rsbP 3 [Capsulimonas sp.]